MEKNNPTERMLAAADRVDNVDMRVREIEVEMAQHEAQCEERWKTTFNRLQDIEDALKKFCLLYTSPSPRDLSTSRMPSSA